MKIFNKVIIVVVLVLTLVCCDTRSEIDKTLDKVVDRICWSLENETDLWVFDDGFMYKKIQILTTAISPQKNSGLEIITSLLQILGGLDQHKYLTLSKERK